VVTLLLVLGAACIYQAAVIASVWIAWRVPPNPPRRTPASLGVGFDEIWFPTSGSCRLHGWWVPAAEAGAPVVLLVHGWGRNVERMLPYVKPLHRAGFALLAFDARHHGLSDRDGFASMKKFSEDIRAATDEIARRAPEVGDAVGVVGLSVGGAAAIHAAAHDRRLVAVVTVGAFAHPAEAMRPTQPWRAVLAPGLPLAMRAIELRVGARLDDLAPERNIGDAGARFLLVHGERDVVVPVSHARRLAAAAGPKAESWIMPERGHSDPHLEPGFFERVRSFLDGSLLPGDGSGRRAS
jgi:uncharacterized protein